MNDAQPERYVDAQELAALMGVSLSTVKRLRRAGMPSETWGLARTRRFLPSQAISWAREQARISHQNRDGNPGQRQPKE